MQIDINNPILVSVNHYTPFNDNKINGNPALLLYNDNYKEMISNKENVKMNRIKHYDLKESVNCLTVFFYFIKFI